jgi:protein-S-isoprenylcysteine O-methyltransferase Ste14
MARTDTARDAARDSTATTPESRTMIPGRARRRFRAESILMRLVATAGIVALGVVLGAILVASDVSGWIVGLVVALVSVVLAGMLWSSRQL